LREASVFQKKIAARQGKTYEAYVAAERKLARARAELDDPSFIVARVLEMYPEH